MTYIAHTLLGFLVGLVLIGGWLALCATLELGWKKLIQKWGGFYTFELWVEKVGTVVIIFLILVIAARGCYELGVWISSL